MKNALGDGKPDRAPRLRRLPGSQPQTRRGGATRRPASRSTIAPGQDGPLQARQGTQEPLAGWSIRSESRARRSPDRRSPARTSIRAPKRPPSTTSPAESCKAPAQSCSSNGSATLGTCRGAVEGRPSSLPCRGRERELRNQQDRAAGLAHVEVHALPCSSSKRRRRGQPGKPRRPTSVRSPSPTSTPASTSMTAGRSGRRSRPSTVTNARTSTRCTTSRTKPER